MSKDTDKSFDRRRRTTDGASVNYQPTARSTQVGENAQASGDLSTAFGPFSLASEDESGAFGAYTRAQGRQTLVGGTYSGARGPYNALWGHGAVIEGMHNAGVGQALKLLGEDNSGVGQSLKIVGDRNTGVGRLASIAGDDDIGIGVNVAVNHNQCIIIGNNQSSTENDQIIIATDGNTNLRVDSDGAVFVNNLEVGELFTPNSAETATDSFSPSATSGTWSAWRSLFAATAHRALRLMFTITGSVTNVTDAVVEIQFGRGAAASETNIFGSHSFVAGAGTTQSAPVNLQATMDIAASTRITWRVRQVGASSISRATDIVLTMLEVV